MHEHSLVRALLSQVKEMSLQHKAVCVDEISVEIGLLSGVEEQLVRSAWQQLSPEYFSPQPTLTIQSIGLHLKCSDCGIESQTDGLSFQCPACSSVSVRVTRGDEFRLMDVSMQIPAEEKEPDREQSDSRSHSHC